MKMIMVSPPRTHLIQPCPIPFFIFAHLNLGPWKNKDAGDAWVGCGGLDDVVMLFGPLIVDIGTIRSAH